MMRLRGELRARILLRTIDRLPPNARGISAMLGAMAAFSCGDALMKGATASLPAGEAIFIRGVLATAMIWSLGYRTGAIDALPRIFSRPMAWRTLSDGGASFFFIAALGSMPLADVAAIMQTNPLAVTAGAALFLGEHVGWRRWTATAVGFLGVLLIIQPGSSAFTWASMLVMAAVFAAAARDILTRFLVGIPSVLIAGTAATSTMVLSLFLLVTETWHMPITRDVMLAAGAAVCMLSGQILVVKSIRAADVSTIVPFRYSAILWSLLLSFVFWHYLPNPLSLCGIAIVCGAGLYTLFRERTLRRKGKLG